MNPQTIEMQVLPSAEGLPLPAYQTEGSSGMDLLAALEEPLTIEPGRIALVPTGLRVALPEGFEFQVRPRSGLAIRHGITVLNSPGTVDEDYRGEVRIILANLGPEAYTVTRGMRIAQLVLARVEKCQWCRVEELEETARGSGGFGHTGTETLKTAPTHPP